MGITIEVECLRWAGFVDYTDYNFQGGKRTLNAKLVGLFDLLNYIFVWPDPFWPIQGSSRSPTPSIIGPIVSVIETMCSDQLRRISPGCGVPEQSGSDPESRCAGMVPTVVARQHQHLRGAENTDLFGAAQAARRTRRCWWRARCVWNPCDGHAETKAWR